MISDAESITPVELIFELSDGESAEGISITLQTKYHASSISVSHESGAPSVELRATIQIRRDLKSQQKLFEELKAEFGSAFQGWKHSGQEELLN